MSGCGYQTDQLNTLNLLKFRLAYLSHAHVRPPAEPLLNFYDVAHTALPFSEWVILWSVEWVFTTC